MVQGIATQTTYGSLYEAGTLGLIEHRIRHRSGADQIIRLSARSLSLPDQGSCLSTVFGSGVSHAAETPPKGQSKVKSLLSRIKNLGKCLFPCLNKKRIHKRQLQEQVLILKKEKLQLLLNAQSSKHQVDWLKQELARMMVERNDIEHFVLEELGAIHPDYNPNSTDTCELHHQDINDEFFQQLERQACV